MEGLSGGRGGGRDGVNYGGVRVGGMSRKAVDTAIQRYAHACHTFSAQVTLTMTHHRGDFPHKCIYRTSATSPPSPSYHPRWRGAQSGVANEPPKGVNHNKARGWRTPTQNTSLAQNVATPLQRPQTGQGRSGMEWKRLGFVLRGRPYKQWCAVGHLPQCTLLRRLSARPERQQNLLPQGVRH